MKISRAKKPAEMSLEQWQTALRREFGAAQEYKLENVGDERFFSDFMVENPATGGRYKVAIRSGQPGPNYCSCPDFAINTLGTCKHVEFVLSRLRCEPGAEAAFARGRRAAYSSVYLRYGRSREVAFKAGTSCSPALRSLADIYFDRNGVLLPEGFFGFDYFLKAAHRTGCELRCYDDALEYIARVRDREALQERVDEVYPGPKASALNRLLKTSLYPYQKAGALAAARAGRFIIADEMGLGKTVQALAACEILARLRGLERTLVICPASLKQQWKNEIEKFTGRKAAVIEGPTSARSLVYREEAFFKIVNYDLVHRDLMEISRWAPDLIILDEAQRIKNWKTRAAQAVKKLDSSYALVLTGTPLENRLEELHSIVEFVDRFHLGPRFRFLDEHQQTDEAGMVVGYKNLSGVARTLETILIRRTKNEVLKELPGRLEKNFFVEMTPQQMRLHEENRETVTRIVAKWRRNHFLSETDQRVLTMALQNMRMSCNSTYLLDHQTDFGAKADELIALLDEIWEDPEAKVVVFSQWLGTHELILRRLKGNGDGYAFLHGGVPSSKRKDLIQRFGDDPRCRLFLSTEAGSVGLNLQCASTVVNMDLPWNPAILEQRIGRVHRLGQKRPVRVVNFIARGTIEHGMLSLLAFKKSLFAGVLDGGQDEVFLGGSRLKRFMESVEQTAGAIPAAPPADTDPPTAEERDAAREAASPAEQTWSEVATAGLAFLDKLSQALSGPTGSPADSVAAPAASVERDPAGRSYVRFPLPGPEVLKKLADLFSRLSGQ